MCHGGWQICRHLSADAIATAESEESGHHDLSAEGTRGTRLAFDLPKRSMQSGPTARRASCFSL